MHIRHMNEEDRGASKHTQFVFRPPKDQEELSELLRLRYETFRNCVLKQFVPENRPGIDLDAYDRFAHHMGLFRAGADGVDTAVGYIRVITDSIGPQAHMVEDIADMNPAVRKRAMRTPSATFPALENFPEATVFYERARAESELFVEPSRLSLHPRIRSIKLGLFVLHATMAYCYFQGGVNGILECLPSYLRLYRALGFQPYPDDTPRLLPSRGVSPICLVRWKPVVERATQRTILRMASEFARDGAISSNPHDPETRLHGFRLKPRRVRDRHPVTVRAVHHENKAKEVVGEEGWK